jgi:hypothetical protein
MTGEPRRTLSTLRDAVRGRVEATSLRVVADEIGMSFSGLRTFLQGARPNEATRSKVVAWYVSSQQGSKGSITGDTDVATALVAAFVARASGKAKTRRAVDAMRRVLEELSVSERRAVLEALGRGD